MKNFLLRSSIFLEHDTGQHVENAGRLAAIFHRLGECPGWTPLDPRAALEAEIQLCHQSQVTEKLAQITSEGGGWADGDTCVSPRSWEVARLAVGGGLRLLEEVVTSRGQGFALVRPPGHHATPVRSMGFCLYSNIAIAARYAREKLGLERVFVLDWDVHHGNGTQDCLESSPEIGFVSFHQWPLYPGSGWYDERGQGNLYNLPLPAGCGDAEYLFAMHYLVRPVLQKWDPQLLLVSCGYDAHASDPLGSMGISTSGFGQMAALLAEWCPQALRVGFLEGGYHPQALAQSVEATLRAWENKPEASQRPRPEQFSSAFLKRIYEAEEFWKR
ncbi:histone deacetylase [bacterium]|nr:histone deacetylase [bacterium]